MMALSSEEAIAGQILLACASGVSAALVKRLQRQWSRWLLMVPNPRTVGIWVP
jgi:hypothetical protein